MGRSLARAGQHGRPDRGNIAGVSRRLWSISLASLAVVMLSVLASFRLGFAADLATVWRANGARVLLGLAAGSAFGLAAALPLERDALPPLRDLQWLVAACLAAGGGVLASRGRPGPMGIALFLGTGAVLGALGWVLVGRLNRARRWTNLAALVSFSLAALAGGYVRARRDVTVPVRQAGAEQGPAEPPAPTRAARRVRDELICG
jgi:hypothetical protein